MSAPSNQYTLRKGDDKGRNFYVARFNTVKPVNLARANVKLFRKGRENLPPEEKKQPFAHLPDKKKEQFVRLGKAIPWIIQDPTKKIDFSGTHQPGVSNSRYVFLVKNADDTLTVYPCNDWYLFQPNVANQTVIPYEEAEKILASKDRWEARAAALNKPKGAADPEEGEEGANSTGAALSVYGYAAEGSEEVDAARKQTEEEKGEHFDFEHTWDDDNKEETQRAEAVDDDEDTLANQDDEETKALKKLDKQAIAGDDEFDISLEEDEEEKKAEEGTEGRGKKRKAETEAAGVAKKPKLSEPDRPATPAAVIAEAEETVIEGYTERQLEEEIRKTILVRKLAMKELLAKYKPNLKNPDFKAMLTRVIKKRVKAIEEDGKTYLKWKDDNF